MLAKNAEVVSVGIRGTPCPKRTDQRDILPQENCANIPFVVIYVNEKRLALCVCMSMLATPIISPAFWVPQNLLISSSVFS